MSASESVGLVTLYLVFTLASVVVGFAIARAWGVIVPAALWTLFILVVERGEGWEAVYKLVLLLVFLGAAVGVVARKSQTD